jgi:hypothetical protein
MRRLLIAVVSLAALSACGVLWLPRCPRPIGNRWTEVRRASAPDTDLVRTGRTLLYVSVVIDQRGHLDSTLVPGVVFRKLYGDATVVAQGTGGGWIKIDSLPAGLWAMQPYRVFAAEEMPFVVETRAGYADSVRVATRYTKVVYLACRARRPT